MRSDKLGIELSYTSLFVRPMCIKDHDQIRRMTQKKGLRSPGIWLRGRDLNPGPQGYEPCELPDCSTPRHVGNNLLPCVCAGVKLGQ